MSRFVPRSALRAALAAAAFLAASCGGPTGVELRVDVPSTWVVGDDFNGIHVEATPDGDLTQTVGDTYALTKLSPTPYVVYIYADGKKTWHTLSIRADLRMNNSIKKTTTLSNLVLKPGQTIPEVADLSQP